MNADDIKRLLEALEETCFPIQIDWNREDLYIKGLLEALKKSKLELVEAK